MDTMPTWHLEKGAEITIILIHYLSSDSKTCHLPNVSCLTRKLEVIATTRSRGADLRKVRALTPGFSLPRSFLEKKKK